MPDVLRQTAPQFKAPKIKRRKVSAIAVLLAVILTITLVLLGERIIFDLNRVANPVVQNADTTSTFSTYRSGYISEGTAVSTARVYYPQDKKPEYLLYKLLIHSAFIIPVFLLTFILYYYVYLKSENSKYKVLAGGYMVFSFWMMIRLLFEVGHYIVVQYKSAAIYIILVALALIFTGLIVIVQKKFAQRQMS